MLENIVWLTLLVKVVNRCLLDICQLCSLPHDCVALNESSSKGSLSL